MRFSKTVNETYDYGFNYASKLDTGDTISLSTWTIPAGLTTGATGNDTTSTSVFLSGGTLDAEYRCINKITTAGGRVVERAFDLIIVAVKYA